MRKIRTLLVPYYVFSLYFLAKPFAVLAVPSLRESFQSAHDYGIAHQFYDVLIDGNGLWFLMAFFVGEILTYGLVMLVKGSQYALTAIGVSLVILAYARATFIPDFVLPFQILQGINVAGFMCLGVALREVILGMTRKAAATAGMVGIAVVVAVALILIPSNSMPMPAMWGLRTVAAFAGAFGTMFLCDAVHGCRLLAYVGRNSLVFYALNAITLNVAKLAVFRVIGINAIAWLFPAQLVMGAVVLMIAFALLFIENLFVQRFMWWSIGKNRRKC